MSTEIVDGQTDWRLTQDEEGYREYKIKFLIRCSSSLDGPYAALLTPGLPLIGSMWAFDNDVDPWVWRRPNAIVTPVVTNRPNKHFTVEMRFSNKPVSRDRSQSQRCEDQQVEDPLMLPARIRGSTSRITAEGLYDKDGQPITNSSWEPIHGPQNEWDESVVSIVIDQNVPTLDHLTVEGMMDSVNSEEMWGYPPRTVKLSSWEWSPQMYGSCYKYYSRSLTFEVRYRASSALNPTLQTMNWDRTLVDQGTKALNGEWDATTGAWVLKNINGVAPNPLNPTHFCRMHDRAGNVMTCLLNGAGLPLDALINAGNIAPVEFLVQKYPENEFITALGIPSTL